MRSPVNILKPFKNIGFTLVELIVVITIVAIFTVLAIPATFTAIERSKTAQCLGNLRTVGSAMKMFVADYNYGPPHSGPPFWDPVGSEERQNKLRWRWMTYLAPYLGSPDYKGPMPSVFNCPKDTNVKTWPIGRTYLPNEEGSSSILTSYGYNYLHFTTSASWFYGTNGRPRCVPMNMIPNPSSIILIADGAPTINECRILYSAPPALRHQNRFNAFFVDGHVASLDQAAGKKTSNYEPKGYGE